MPRSSKRPLTAQVNYVMIGTSRTPLREAIRRLQTEGFDETQRKLGPSNPARFDAFNRRFHQVM